MTVYSSDGEKLGKIIAVRGDIIDVEKGFFFPKDYSIALSDIADVRGDEVHLLLAKERLGMGAGTGMGATERYEDRSAETLRGQEEVRVPVAHEQLDVLKREREAGAVRLTKDVVEETKTVSVPVTREEVRVERVPVNPDQPLPPGARAFERDEVVVPIREEEVEVAKRPVVSEEVVIRKDRELEERRVAEGVRREEVRVEGADEKIGRGAPGSFEDDPLKRR